MSWEAIGAIGEVLGALGVIVSLVYLALQIRQNSALLRQTVAVDRANAAVISASYGIDFARSIALDRETSDIWARGLSAPESLDPQEQERFDQLMLAQLIQIDVNHFLGTMGPLDPQVHAIWDRVLDSWIDHPRFRAQWEAGRVQGTMTSYTQDYVRQKLAGRGGVA